jgi:cAMP phosphodiesterase
MGGTAGHSILPSPLRVRLLPSSTAPDPQRQLLTTFLVDDSIAIDAGSLAFALTTEEMRRIRHILITHAHVDHTASLPIFISETFPALTAPVSVHATQEVIAALRRFVFNGDMWPDFTQIPLPNGRGPALEFCPVEPGTPFRLGDLKVTPIRVNHVVPTVGFVVEGREAGFAITSDTYVTDEIWTAAGRLQTIKAIFVDVSYPNEMEDLAAASRHFTPRSLASDLRNLARDVPICVVHIKPAYREAVIRQLAELRDPRISVVEIGRSYEW